MPYHQHLSNDKTLKKIVAQHPPIQLTKTKNLFNTLCASIMSQQLSIKVADVIHQRFLDLFKGAEPTPEAVLSIDFDKLKAIGLSNSKTVYIKNVAQFAIDFGLENKKLNKLTDEELIAYLTQIKGVGRWTVEMLMMFALGRENIFAPDDLGIQIAMIELYKLDNSNKKKLRTDMLQIAENWHPYRTYACLLLWKHKDAEKKKKKK